MLTGLGLSAGGNNEVEFQMMGGTLDLAEIGLPALY
jgi:hypothetical protein